MKKNHRWIAMLPILFALVVFLPLQAQTQTGNMTDLPAVREMSSQTPRVPMLSVKPNALKAWLVAKNNALIVDVRAADTFHQGHLDGAVNYPLNALPERYYELPLDRSILLVDADGTTALLAGSYLKRKGFREVVRLFGGMEAWQAFHARTGK